MRRSAPVSNMRICIFCQAGKKYGNRLYGGETCFTALRVFFESKNMRKYFHFPEFKMPSGLEKYKLY